MLFWLYYLSHARHMRCSPKTSKCIFFKNTILHILNDHTEIEVEGRMGCLVRLDLPYDTLA